VHTALRGNADETGWTPAEKVALYSVQSRLDLRAPNFWELVSDALLDLGFEKSAKQCQQKWFEVRGGATLMKFSYIVNI
jgi:hypothetical protein